MPRTPLYHTAPFALLLGLAGLQLVHGGPFYAMWVQDIFVPLEAVLHRLRGDHLYVDFHAPLGPLYLAPHELAARVFGLSAATVVQADLVMGWLAAGLVLAVGRGRLGTAPCAVLATLAGLVAASPRQLGQWPDVVTYNASYNRYGWALMVPLCLLLAVPRRGRGRPAAEGVWAGLLLVLLALVKVTYAPVGAGLAGLALLTVRRAGAVRFGAAAAITGAALLVAVQLSTGLLLPYLVELRRAASVQADPARFGQALVLAGASAPGLVLVMVAGVLAGQGRARLGMAGATVLAGVVLGTQNHLALENPLLPVAGVVAWVGGSAVGARRVAGLVVLAGLLVPPLALDVVSVGWTAVAPASRDPALDGTVLAGLRFGAQENRVAESGEVTNDAEYVAVLADGMALLRPLVRPGSTVLPLTWTNPFPVLMGLPPPRGELLWWDEGRSFSAAVKPEGEALFAGVDLVMIPATYFDYRTTVAMRRVYADVLDRMFEPAGQSRFWRVLRRRGQIPAAVARSGE